MLANPLDLFQATPRAYKALHLLPARQATRRQIQELVLHRVCSDTSLFKDLPHPLVAYDSDQCTNVFDFAEVAQVAKRGLDIGFSCLMGDEN